MPNPTHFSFTCPRCSATFESSRFDQAFTHTCTECQMAFEVAPVKRPHPTPETASTEKPSQLSTVLMLAGIGAALASIEIGAALFLAGLMILIFHHPKEVQTICSECGNSIKETSRTCPTCNAQFPQSMAEIEKSNTQANPYL